MSFLPNNKIWQNQHKYRLTAEIHLACEGKGHVITKEAYFSNVEEAFDAQRNFTEDLCRAIKDAEDCNDAMTLVTIPPFRANHGAPYNFGDLAKFAIPYFLYYSTKVEQYVGFRSESMSESLAWEWQAPGYGIVNGDGVYGKAEAEFIERI